MSAITIERDGPVETLSINDAPRNRMSLEFIDELEVEIERLRDDSDIRAVVIRGAGEEHFSVGMDLKQLPEGIKQRGSPDVIFDQRLKVLRDIETLNKPVIAVMCGYCLGGGLELPLACHFRLAAEEGTQMGLPEMDLGTVPAWGGSARLTRRVGRDHALDLILRARKISGPEAYRIGLVTEVHPLADLFGKAHQLAHDLAAQPALAVQAMLRCIVGSEGKTLEQSLADERAAVHETLGSPDAMEGMMAFLEKRKPVFNQ